MGDASLADSTATESSIDWQTWPNVEYPDIYNYLICTTSFYTKDLTRAWKDINSTLMGSEIIVLPIPCNLKANLICAKVKHSQMLSAVPLNKPWMVVEKEGTVICCAHCDYMAGLGEACSHNAAIFLFWMHIPKKRKGFLYFLSL